MNIFNDPQVLQQLQQMGINPYQLQAFLQSPQGMQVQQECNQYLMSKFGEYVQSLNQNFGQMGKSDVPNEEVEQLKAQNQALEQRLEERDKDIEEIKQMLISNQKGGKNGNK